MQVLHVLDHSLPLASGYTYRTLAILRRQRQMGWETWQLTGPKHDSGSLFEEHVGGWHFFRTPSPRGWLAAQPLLRHLAVVSALSRRLESVARQLRPDLIHAHSPALNGEAAIRVGRRLGIPVVYEIRALWEDAAASHGTGRAWGVRYRLSRLLESRVLRRAREVTTICEGLKREILSRGIPEAKVTVIPNGVEPDDFPYGEPPDPLLLERLGVAGKVVLGFLGSFYGYEGLSFLLERMPLLMKRHPEVFLLLAGGGPEAGAVRRRLGEADLAGRVIDVGRVSHEEARRLHGVVDIFVFPRLSMRLTELVTPLKPLEAMACGKVVVASDVGGHRELIEHGRNGFLFAAGDGPAFDSCLEGVLQDRDRWREIGEEARRYVVCERNWRISVDRYREVYGRGIG
ncbi:MAG: glycosyltransferase, exosortase A system-associated [Magnetococcales bacterium]|nr:glycosyltransferase, exosortase A system-associated [Magnetococcales bacterium]MBF0156545.1 glycosyltransferase, exosortase A system-associated [Magnetococcales bacterium]